MSYYLAIQRDMTLNVLMCCKTLSNQPTNPYNRFGGIVHWALAQINNKAAYDFKLRKKEEYAKHGLNILITYL